jgi:uncharacterized protein
MMQGKFQEDFGQNKQQSLPRECLECPFLKMCGGDCPKHRFMETGSGERISYLHEGFLYFFRHADQYMKMMAGEVNREKPAGNIMETFPRKERERLLKRSSADPRSGAR